MKFTPLPSQARLKELLDYGPLTGGLVWRNPPANNQRMKGKPAGTLNIDGYLKISIGGRKYTAQRIIWVWVTGKDPGEIEVDHKDHDHLNNCWSNLRLATVSQNRSNVAARNKTGLPKGVFPSGSGYRARIRKDHKAHNLGTFDTPEEAHQAYCEAAILLHGEFACLA